MRLPYVIGNDSISVMVDTRFRTVARNTAAGKRLVTLLDAPIHDVEAIRECADVTAYINRATFGRVTVGSDDQIRLDGEVIDYGVTLTMLNYLDRGADVSSLVNYIERVAENPNGAIAADLFRFLSKGNLPITPDGKIRAFKGVKDDFRSRTTGHEEVLVEVPAEYRDRALNALGLDEDSELAATGSQVFVGRIPHPIGATLLMSRDLCDPDPGKTCSVGLHACSVEYLGFWYGSNDRLLIVEIDPADVTAIPTDHNDQKLRCCSYTIIGALPREDAEAFFTTPVDRRRYDGSGFVNSPDPEESGLQTLADFTASDDLDDDDLEEDLYDDDDLEEDLYDDDFDLYDDEHLYDADDPNDEFEEISGEEVDTFFSNLSAEGDVQFSMSDEAVSSVVDPVEDDVEVALSAEEYDRWFDLGYEVGLDDGEGNLQADAEWDDTPPRGLDGMPSDPERLAAFDHGYRKGYSIGFPDQASDALEERAESLIHETATQVADHVINGLAQKALNAGFIVGAKDRDEGGAMDMRPSRSADHPNDETFRYLFELSFGMAYMAGYTRSTKPTLADIGITS